MKRLPLPFVAAATALTLLLATPGEALPTTLVSPVGNPRGISGNGASVCNCTPAPATLQVCHAATVTLHIGSDTVHVSTGQSTTTCASQIVQPGTCAYFRYNFECEPSFFSWNCRLRSASLWNRPADPQLDC